MPAWEQAPEIGGQSPAKRPSWADAPEIGAQAEATYDPTEGMSTTEKVLAGIGSGMVSVGRAIGLGGVAKHYGLPSTKEEAEAIDAPLMATKAGKVGDFIGRAAVTAPTALIPGANTYAGAALVGATTGAATTEGGLSERALGAGGGALGGAVGKGVGDAIGAVARKGVDWLNSRGATQQAANAGRDAATATATSAGYKIPPSQANPSVINRTLESFAGKTSVAQGASNANQEVTNTLARKALGLAPNTPLNKATLDGIRAQAGGAYDALSRFGSFKADGQFARDLATIRAPIKAMERQFPELADPALNNIITAVRKSDFDSAATIQALKKLRFDGNANRAVQDPAKKALGRVQIQAADALEGLIERNLGRTGRSDLLSQFRDARQLIAKTYTVEKALNDATGNVSAPQLGNQLAKGRPLSGDLRQAAQFGMAFPKAAQDPAKVGSVLGSSPLDWFGSIGLSAATQNPLLLATAAARPAVRSAILSAPYQAVAARAPSYGPGTLTQTAPQVLESEVAKAIARLSGIEGGRRQAVGR